MVNFNTDIVVDINCIFRAVIVLELDFEYYIFCRYQKWNCFQCSPWHGRFEWVGDGTIPKYRNDYHKFYTRDKKYGACGRPSKFEITGKIVNPGTTISVVFCVCTVLYLPPRMAESKKFGYLSYKTNIFSHIPMKRESYRKSILMLALFQCRINSMLSLQRIPWTMLYKQRKNEKKYTKPYERLTLWVTKNFIWKHLAPFLGRPSCVSSRHSFCSICVNTINERASLCDQLNESTKKFETFLRNINVCPFKPFFEKASIRLTVRIKPNFDNSIIGNAMVTNA